MTASWTITENAVWQWTYSSLAGEGDLYGDNTVYGDTATAVTIRVDDTGEGTFLTTDYTQADQEGTYATSTIAATATTVRTTKTEFDTENGISTSTSSASYNSDLSSIVTFSLPTTATISASIETMSSVLTTTAGGTYLRPIDLPAWLDVNVGDAVYAPTVVLWSSAAGYRQPTAINASSLPSVVSLGFSGQKTIYPDARVFQIPSFTSFAVTFTEQTWQSLPATWTRQAETDVTLTQSVASKHVITGETETYETRAHTTRTTSSNFLFVFSYHAAPAAAMDTWSSFWTSTTLTASTFTASNETIRGSGTTTLLVSSVASTYVNDLQENQAGQQPLAAFEMSRESLRGFLTVGSYSHFTSQNIGRAIKATQQPAAVFSHDGNSFPLPGVPFATALWQPGVTAPVPSQTRLVSNSSGTTIWSLGVSRLSVIERTSNTSTQGASTSTYAFNSSGPSQWSTSSRSLAQYAFTAAGGQYASNSFFDGGGFFSATRGTSEFTGTDVTVGSAVTAFQPLPYFAPQIGPAGVSTFQGPLLTSASGALGLRTLAFPLTA